MLLKELLQRLQSVYNKGVPSQSKRLSDRHIYNKLLTLRSKLLYQQVSKKQKISDFNYSVIDCIELEEVPHINCPCVPRTGCNVMRTKYPLPKPVSNFSSHLIEYVCSIDKKTRFTESSAIEYQYKSHNKYTHSLPVYIIENNFGYFYGNNIPKAVSIKLLLSDPITAYSHPTLCSTEGLIVDNCIDIREINFPIDDHLLEDMLELAKQEIKELLLIEDDTRNNMIDDVEPKK